MSDMSKEELLKQLQSGALLLCVNQRLARYWLYHYEQWQQSLGRGAWATPATFALQHWVQQQYRVHGFAQSILSGSQEKALWQHIIDHDIGTTLLDSRAMATRAQEAYELLQRYQLDLSNVQEENQEVQCFKRWACAFEARLGKDHQLVASQVSAQLAQAVAQQQFPLASKIIWAGFDDINPMNQALLDGMQVHHEVSFYQPKAKLGQAESWQCHDEESELRRICERIRQIYPEKQHIGVLVPDMQRRKEAISRVFHAELSPQSVLLAEEHKAAFNLSLGSPLIGQPLIRFVFLLLRCCNHSQIQFEHMSALLLSPYLFPMERRGRAQLEQLLRCENMERFRLKDLLAWPAFVRYASSTHAAFVSFQQLDLPRQQLPSEWLSYIHQVLLVFEVEQRLHLGSEKAQWRSWLDVNDKISVLDDLLGSLPFLSFLTVLQQSCAEQAFRPDPSQSSIQVMGMLEASGMVFDHVFVVGMHENAWPTQAKPHPLLPLNLQREHQMPHADAQREFDYANQVWQNILMSSHCLEISFPLVADGQDTRPSCLLQAMPKQVHTGNETAQWQQQLFAHPAQMDDVQTAYLPPSAHEKISGGASLLHAQARCSFKAFAQFRMKIQALASKPHAGFNPLQRGNLLHEVLNLFWFEIKTLQQLKELVQANRLTTQLQHCITHVLENQQLRAHPLHQQFEQQRLIHVLEKWFALELERPDFSVVACEQAYDVNVALPSGSAQSHLALRVKIDRIDQDEQGNMLLLDYKTGRVDLKGMLKDPFLEPQLPLYLQVESLQKADAVAFASIRADDKGPHFAGLSRVDALLPNVDAQDLAWEDQLQQWQQGISHLAADFFLGDTKAEPHQKQDCSYCQMQRLCRI
ncbi:MAG: PD-(D/E)XK nuclease family protein [Mariprofundaceae bacterium]|nr:PD-(D/E)XK nuclease family protein [Mariprofundaceae bacterium]